MPKRRPTDSQGEPPFLRSPIVSGQFRFTATISRPASSHTTEPSKTPRLRLSTLRGAAYAVADPLKRDNFKDCTLRLVTEVTARNIKRG